MKTISEQKFDTVIKDTFHVKLKELGFKKKGNNFYLFSNGIGKIINIQKSSFYSKEHIHFTINIGIFSPEYWNAMFNRNDENTPNFPLEMDCVIRQRIGALLNQNDTWYDIEENTSIGEIKKIQEHNVTDVILPFFNLFTSIEELLFYLEKNDPISPFARIIILVELNRIEEAKKEKERLLSKYTDINFKHRLIAICKDYEV